MSKKRIFVGLQLDTNDARFVYDWSVNNLNKLAGKITPGNLHITLVPPWYSSDIKEITEKLKSVKFKPFDLKFSVVENGPGRKDPRLIWARGDVPEQLLELKSSIDRSLSIKPGTRKYLLHLTLARYPASIRQDIRLFRENIDWKFYINNFSLYESVLSSKGANYTVLEKFSF